MAKSKAPETTEIINQGEFISRLGISQPTWNKHPEYREFLEQQDGVTFEARKSYIPAHLVETLRDAFDIVPGAKRAPRGTNGRKTSNRKPAGIDYSTLSVEDLLTHKKEAEEVLGDDTDFQAEIQELEERLEHLRQKEDAKVKAGQVLTNINRALQERKDALTAEKERLAQEEALLESLNA